MENFTFKKSFGQNFIKEDNIIDKIVNVSDIDKDTLVIEIGPGAGSLSKKIIPLAGFSLLYEIDTRLKDTLDSLLCLYDNYRIIFNDFLLQDVKNDIKDYKYKKLYVVANLPYYITTPIITKLINEVSPDKIVIMVQEEVANRLSSHAGTKDYGMISVLIGSKYTVKKMFNVSRHCFVPEPNVDSSVISLDKHNLYKIDDYNKFESFLKNAFQYKRKNLKNNLKAYDLNKIEFILNKYGFNLCNRAEELSIDIFIDIVNNL